MNSNKNSTSHCLIEILLVEDDPADVKLTMRALRKGRVLNNIHVARDGIEAMQYLRKEGTFADAPRPDLIILDLNMPRMDGRETLRALKNDPNLRVIPVVVLTTSDSETDVMTSYLEHANCYITKPVNIEQFQKAIVETNAYWISVVRLSTKSHSP